MNVLAQMRQLKDEIRQREEAIRNLENNPQLKEELAFETELRAVLSKFGKSLEDAVAVFDPSLHLSTAPQRRSHHAAPSGAGTPRRKRRTPEELEAAGVKRRPGSVGKDRVVAPVATVYTYTNPYNQETIVTANVALHRQGKEWIAQYGKDVVKSWGVAQ
jgi:hypothetical protein